MDDDGINCGDDDEQDYYSILGNDNSTIVDRQRYHINHISNCDSNSSDDEILDSDSEFNNDVNDVKEDEVILYHFIL